MVLQITDNSIIHFFAPTGFCLMFFISAL
jgi:hypothetical protein